MVLAAPRVLDTYVCAFCDAVRLRCLLVGWNVQRSTVVCTGSCRRRRRFNGSAFLMSVQIHCYYDCCHSHCLPPLTWQTFVKSKRDVHVDFRAEKKITGFQYFM